MRIEERIYGKSELALVYFPSCDPATALRRLTRWIKRNRELSMCLSDCHNAKYAKIWTRQQVYLIKYYLGEP